MIERQSMARAVREGVLAGEVRTFVDFLAARLGGTPGWGMPQRRLERAPGDALPVPSTEWPSGSDL